MMDFAVEIIDLKRGIYFEHSSIGVLQLGELGAMGDADLPTSPAHRQSLSGFHMLLCRRTPYEWVYRRHSYGSHRPNPRGRPIRHASELHETKPRTRPRVNPQTNRPHSSPCHIDSRPATDQADSPKETRLNPVFARFRSRRCGRGRPTQASPSREHASDKTDFSSPP